MLRTFSRRGRGRGQLRRPRDGPGRSVPEGAGRDRLDQSDSRKGRGVREGRIEIKRKTYGSEEFQNLGKMD